MLKAFTITFLSVVALASCSHDIQLVTVKSDIIQNDTLLRYGNDTFEIVYNLFDKNGAMSFGIYNKSAQPLYVDWKRSALIKGTQKQDYWNSAVRVSTQSISSSVEWLYGFSSTYGISSGIMVQEEQITFIPPGTFITFSRFYISNHQFSTEGYKKELVQKNYLERKSKTQILQNTFSKDNSPLQFRNFLTMSLKHDFSTEFYVDHFFWAEKIEEMSERQFDGLLIRTSDGYRDYFDYTYPYRKPNAFYIPVNNVE